MTSHINNSRLQETWTFRRPTCEQVHWSFHDILTAFTVMDRPIASFRIMLWLPDMDEDVRHLTTRPIHHHVISYKKKTLEVNVSTLHICYHVHHHPSRHVYRRLATRQTSVVEDDSMRCLLLPSCWWHTCDVLCTIPTTTTTAVHYDDRKMSAPCVAVCCGDDVDTSNPIAVSWHST